MQELLAWAQMEGNSGIQERCGQKNAWDAVTERGTGWHVLAAVFGLGAHYALTSPGSAFSQSCKRFARLQNAQRVQWVCSTTSKPAQQRNSPPAGQAGTGQRAKSNAGRLLAERGTLHSHRTYVCMVSERRTFPGACRCSLPMACVTSRNGEEKADVSYAFY